MPNRILRDGIIESEAVNRLRPEAELLFRRLMSKVDDYGRFYGHPDLIRAACYPLQLDRVMSADVRAMLAECAQEKLVLLYEHEGKKYLEIIGFGQRTRTDSKFPAPCAQNDRAMSAECAQNDRGLQARARARSESESESESESNAQSESHVCDPKPNCHKPPRAADVGQVSLRFEEFCEKYPRISDIDGTGHLWVSHVTVENEAAVFKELDCYLASSEVARGVILASPRYLLEGHRDRWKRKWPGERKAATGNGESRMPMGREAKPLTAEEWEKLEAGEAV